MLLLINSRLILLPKHHGLCPVSNTLDCMSCVFAKHDWQLWGSSPGVARSIEWLTGWWKRARIIGVEAQMMKFNFCSVSFLGSLTCTLCHSDNLSKILQNKALPATEGQHIAKLTLSVLRKMHSDEHFAAFCEQVIQEQARFGVADSCLPRNSVFHSVLKSVRPLVSFM